MRMFMRATGLVGSMYKTPRCVPRLNGNNVCRYTLPARRLNVFPDGVELVFVDEDKEYDNPSFVAWLILEDLTARGALTYAQGLGQMCDPPHYGVPAAGPSIFLPQRRAFVRATFDGKTYSATNCKKVSSNPDKYDCDVAVQ